jgi:hypothetical protein
VCIALDVIETVNDGIRSGFVGDTRDVDAGDRWACVLSSLKLGVIEVGGRMGERRVALRVERN